MKRGVKKFLFGYCPGISGSFRYFNHRVYFPHRSAAFLAACDQGIFEAANVALLQQLCRSDTYLFDVGANIGLMAIPVLRAVPECKVVSFEPSPNSLPFLRRTRSTSPFRDRWSVVAKAVSDHTGSAEFSVAGRRFGLFDGLKATHRVPEARRVGVQITTVDAEWATLGKPKVSVIKIDVEGGELAVLNGATECIATCLPSIRTEWNRQNLAAYDCPAELIIPFASQFGYRIYSMPNGIAASDEIELELQMLRTESFLLIPDRRLRTVGDPLVLADASATSS